MMLGMTLTAMVASLGVLGFTNYMSRKPHQAGSTWMVPYHAIQFLALVALLLMLAHLISLLTGQPFTGRLGR
jgi:hypothetical protein